MKMKLLIASFLLLSVSAKAQQKVISLYLAATTDISQPTLTVFPADTTVQATGTAVIIYSVGDYFDAARWLNKKGVAAFVLKRSVAVADGRVAIAYVRTHAAEYKISPNQVGIIGFANGGMIAVATAQGYSTANRPDFVAVVNPYISKLLINPAAKDAPPLFIAADTNNLQNIKLYSEWIRAKRPAELHLYVKGSNGLMERFGDWMEKQGWLKPLTNEKTYTQKRAEGFANLQKYYTNLTLTDWAWLFKYKESNVRLKTLNPGENRVVFMGNSITENWGDMDPVFFKDNGYVCRGIGGQVSAQMLVRFREDVINLKPLAVVIEAGTNDIAENRGPITVENIFGNIVSMAELAKANDIRPIIGAVLPTTEFLWHPGMQPAEKIVKLNEMLKVYAGKNHIVYIDYWSAMVNDKKGLKVELARDGLVHPNLAGYKVMEPLAKEAIDETLKKK